MWRAVRVGEAWGGWERAEGGMREGWGGMGGRGGGWVGRGGAGGVGRGVRVEAVGRGTFV